MAAAAKLQEFRGPRLGDAASLWNFAPAPGWTNEEVAVLKLCLMKYGVGCWQAIQRSGLLPGKLVQQLVGQTQRLLGQQSLFAFTGLQVDVDQVRADNDARMDVQRKAGLIINMGRTATPEEKDLMRREMQEKYGLSPITLREVAAELEERAIQRLDQVGGEGLQGVAARAGLHDALGCDASQLPPALAAQLLRRLRIKLGVLVDRLRSHLNLPPVGKREWEDVAPMPEEVVEGDDEPGNSHDGPPPAPPIRRPKRSGRGRGRGRTTAAGNKAVGLLKAAQDDALRGEGGHRKQAVKRRRGAAAHQNASDDDDDSEAGLEVGSSRADADEDDGRRRSHRTTSKAAWEAAMGEDIAALQAMGFSRQKAKTALLEVDGGGVEEALDWLLRQK